MLPSESRSIVTCHVSFVREWRMSACWMAGYDVSVPRTGEHNRYWNEAGHRTVMHVSSSHLGRLSLSYDHALGNLCGITLCIIQNRSFSCLCRRDLKKKRRKRMISQKTQSAAKAFDSCQKWRARWREKLTERQWLYLFNIFRSKIIIVSAHVCVIV